MFLNKRKAIFLINVSVLIFILTINQVKSQTIKIVDGDTIHLNGEKIRFTGIDTPELKQNCLKDGALKILVVLQQGKFLLIKLEIITLNVLVKVKINTKEH